MTEETEVRRGPCTVRDGKFVEPCTALDECIGGNGMDKRKGIVSWTLINLKEGMESRRFIGVRSGKHAAKGLVFNYCPFCATKIDTPVCDDASEAA